MKAGITEKGAVLLGKNVVCDAHEDRPIRVVTHAHSDHLADLEQSLGKCALVVTTPATKEVIDVLKPGMTSSLGQMQRLEYRRRLQLADGRLTLLPAGHIIGSAQVLVENGEGTRIVYTGDFKLPDAPIIPSDLLVIEATYGNPAHTRPFKERVESELVTLVRKELKCGPVYIFGYHGKLQETIAILREFGVDAPIIAPERVYQIAKICEKCGMKLGDYLSSKDDEAQEIIERQPYIGIYHMGARKYVGKDATRLYLSGWEFGEPYRQINEKEYTVALSDHSDFEQLLNYVEESKPRLVITDNYRAGDAQALAREIVKRLGIPAKPMPE